jgi:ribosomal protein S18 acetylase RimI-like enzyme
VYVRLNPAFDGNLLSRIEDAGLNASAPLQQRWLDGWLVRFSPGKAKRARCVNAVAQGRLPVVERLAACAEIYRQAQLPLIVRITPFTVPNDLEALLARQHLRRFGDTRVMVCGDLASSRRGGFDPSIRIVGLEAMAQRVGGFRGSSLAQRQAHAQRLLNSPVPFQAFELQAAGEVVACGQFAIESNLVGLYDIFTAEHARGQGHATTLCRQMLLHAVAGGARHAYLQVEARNLRARNVYRRLGFVDAYAYHYRARAPSPD